MDCLVTKLKGTVSDNQIPKLGEWMFKIKTNGPVGIKLPNSFGSLSGNAIFSTVKEMSSPVSAVTPAEYKDYYVDTKGEVETIVLYDKYSTKLSYPNISIWNTGNRESMDLDLDILLPYTSYKDILNELLPVMVFNIRSAIGYKKCAIRLYETEGTYDDLQKFLAGGTSLRLLGSDTNTPPAGWSIDLNAYGGIECVHKLRIPLYNLNTFRSDTLKIFARRNNEPTTEHIKSASDLLSRCPNLIYIDDWGMPMDNDTFMDALSSRSMNVFHFSGTYTYTSQNFSGKTYSSITGNALGINNLDGFLNAIALANFKAYSEISELTVANQMQLVVYNGTRTTASDAAIQTIRNKGVYVSVPVATDANSIALMSADARTNTWAVGCRNGVPIMKAPVDLTKCIVLPSEDADTLYFDTKENAEKFIADSMKSVMS